MRHLRCEYISVFEQEEYLTWIPLQSAEFSVSELAPAPDGSHVPLTPGMAPHLPHTGPPPLYGRPRYSSNIPGQPGRYPDLSLSHPNPQHAHPRYSDPSNPAPMDPYYRDHLAPTPDQLTMNPRDYGSSNPIRDHSYSSSRAGSAVPHSGQHTPTWDRASIRQIDAMTGLPESNIPTDYEFSGPPGRADMYSSTQSRPL